jgi:hypothetical protein
MDEIGIPGLQLALDMVCCHFFKLLLYFFDVVLSNFALGRRQILLLHLQDLASCGIICFSLFLYLNFSESAFDV